MHPLDGPHLKVARANTEISQLQLMRDDFFANTHYSIVRAEQNSESGKQVYRVKIDGPPLSLDWGIYIGEITHNLRSALNQLIYQLALLNRLNKPEAVARDKRLQFPIFLVESEFKAKGKDMIKLLCPEHKATIERLQPCNSSCGSLFKTAYLTNRSGDNSPLFWLEDINNTDKHRIIQVTGVRPSGFGVTYWGHRDGNPFTGGTFSILEDGVKFGEADPDVDVKINITPHIAFANGCKAIFGMPIHDILNMIAVEVGEIIQLFSRDF